MTMAVGILLSVVAFVSAAVVIGAFVWAARKDGEDQRRRDLGA
jgi:hypothetical protein